MCATKAKRLLWCNTHRRKAHRCAHEAGIAMPCVVVDLTGLVEWATDECFVCGLHITQIYPTCRYVDGDDALICNHPFGVPAVIPESYKWWRETMTEYERGVRDAVEFCENNVMRLGVPVAKTGGSADLPRTLCGSFTIYAEPRYAPIGDDAASQHVLRTWQRYVLNALAGKPGWE